MKDELPIEYQFLLTVVIAIGGPIAIFMAIHFVNRLLFK